ncbi:cyclin-Y-like protein 1 [Trichonephila clavipes]|uniref:Cyclin-Y-like protein 1 n=1 Tax=Trichonephila clavipes TaxID=2585209 RepID=A0A8X6VI92_TRICX|nr:cyclin-Y-like protein 1 [Trichonephila clavipes]
MGNKIACCASDSPTLNRKFGSEYLQGAVIFPCPNSISNLQHISEREPEDFDADPSTHPTAGPIFMQRSKSDVRYFREKRRSESNLLETRPLKKSSSCSTIFLDDSTVSQPNLKNTIKCVTLAIYYHIRNRTSNRTLDIFDERIHPLSVESDYDYLQMTLPVETSALTFSGTLLVIETISTNNGLTPKEIKAKFDAVHGASASVFPTIYNWINEIKCGHISTKDDHLSQQHPVEVSTLEMIDKIHDMMLSDRRTKLHEME